MQVVPANPLPDIDAGIVHVELDGEAEPRNSAPALARLLIQIDRRRRERAAADADQTKNDTPCRIS